MAASRPSAVCRQRATGSDALGEQQPGIKGLLEQAGVENKFIATDCSRKGNLAIRSRFGSLENHALAIWMSKIHGLAL
jgi:hypothetical protein